MISLSFIIFASLSISATSAVYFEACATGSGPMPKEVASEDCEADSDRCKFYRQSTFKAIIDFTARKNVSSLMENFINF